MNVERPFEISTEREKYQRILPVSLSQMLEIQDFAPKITFFSRKNVN